MFPQSLINSFQCETLKHKEEDISLEELANHFCTEEEYRVQKDNKEPIIHVSKINVMEEGPKVHMTKKGQSRKFIKKKSHQFTNFHDNNNKKKKGACFHCRKLRDYKFECCHQKKKGAPATN